MVKGYHFKSFNIKASTAIHPVIQKEVDDLLAKGAIETWTGDPGSYTNVFVVSNNADFFTNHTWCYMI